MRDKHIPPHRVKPYALIRIVIVCSAQEVTPFRGNFYLLLVLPHEKHLYVYISPHLTFTVMQDTHKTEILGMLNHVVLTCCIGYTCCIRTVKKRDYPWSVCIVNMATMVVHLGYTAHNGTLLLSYTNIPGWIIIHNVSFWVLFCVNDSSYTVIRKGVLRTFKTVYLRRACRHTVCFWITRCVIQDYSGKEITV